MLTLGLTGGIGSGKSAVSALLAARGATVVDADVVAREVLAAGTPGLAAVVETFGPDLLRPDGTLDRAGLGSLVFGNDAARSRLDAIVHPRIGERTRALVEAAERSGVQVLVHDVPLLVELGLGPGYHLVVVVDAPVEVRLTRLAQRGLPPEQARARMAAQADEASRRAAADVWLDNSGTRESLQAQVAALHDDRLVPYARNLAERIPARRGPVDLVPASPSWPDEAARLAARLRHLCGSAQVTHVGSTAVPGLAARDVLDLLVELPAEVDADPVLGRLSYGGFPPAGGEPGSGEPDRKSVV